MGLDELESTAAELLGQIQASVQEFLRAMNESAARVRREADEAHRQHEVALKSLEHLERQSRQILENVNSLIRSIATQLPAHVVQGAREAARDEAKLHFEKQIAVADAGLAKATRQLESLAQSLGWRQIVINGFIALSVTAAVLAVVMWHVSR